MNGKEQILHVEKQKLVRIAVIAAVILLLAAAGFLRSGVGGDGFRLDRGEATVSNGSTVSEITASGQEDMIPEDPRIICQIDGQVVSPGVYELEEGSRVYQLIELAGGLTSDAYTAQLNQAELLTDGEKIYIPTEKEAASVPVVQRSGETRPSGTSNGKININTADSTALQKLKGVGPAIAEKIIGYRTKAGRFSSIEEIMNVSGIGPKTFEKMKDSICVN